MDYRFNPITTQLITKKPVSSISFKRDFEVLNSIPSDREDVFIRQSNNNDLKTSREIFLNSISNGWRNLKEVIPLIDPVKAFQDINNEMRITRDYKKNKVIVKSDHGA